MKPLELAVICILVLLMLWIAYRIGKIVLRLLAGLLVLVAVGYLFGIFFIR